MRAWPSSRATHTPKKRNKKRKSETEPRRLLALRQQAANLRFCPRLCNRYLRFQGYLPAIMGVWFPGEAPISLGFLGATWTRARKPSA